MLGDWRKNLTKTPYLVLFILLISIGVGTASAAITITLAGNVHVLGEMKIDETLLMGTDNPNDDDGIRFDDGSEVLFWDESETQFEFTDALVTSGVIQAGNAGADVAYNRIGTGTANSGDVFESSDLLVSGSMETNSAFYADGDIYLGTDNSIDDDTIFFDVSVDEFLKWDDSETQFEFSDAIVTSGVIQAGFNGPDVAYNRIGTGAADSGFVTSNNDLFITGELETNGNLYADKAIFVGGSTVDDAIFFDGGTEFFFWDSDVPGFFQISDDLFLDGVIQVGSGVFTTYNRFGAGTAQSLEGADDLFVADEIELDGALFADGGIWVGTDDGTDNDHIQFDDGTKTLSWDNAQSRFEFNEQLSVNELFIGNDNVDHDIEFFVGGNPSGERFQWDVSADAFEVSDDFTVFGKLTVTGLIDPPAITFSAETHDSIKQLAQNVEDHEEVMQFWNGDNNRFEVYVISQDVFYTFDGQEVKYKSTGIPENSAVNRLAEFEEQERIRMANPEVEDQEPQIEE